MFIEFFTIASFVSLMAIAQDECLLSVHHIGPYMKGVHRFSNIWKILFATFGVFLALGIRMLLLTLIISVEERESFLKLLQLLLFSPGEYASFFHKVESHLIVLGAGFLLPTFMGELFDTKKTTFWFQIEKKCSDIAKKYSYVPFSFVSALFFLILVQYKMKMCLTSAFIGIILCFFVKGVSFLLEKYEKNYTHPVSIFIYLVFLDTAMSSDHIISAFSMSKNLLFIIIGSGIGMCITRSFIVFLSNQKWFKDCVFLEPAITWQLGMTSCVMICNMFFSIPELYIGIFEFIIIALAVYKSIKFHKRKNI